MDNIDDDDNLTNLSWLNSFNNNELQTTVECLNNSIDNDLQCLCWLVKLRPISHSVKRLSSSKNKIDYSVNKNDILISRRVLLNNSLSSQQSFIFIRLSTGKIFCLAIHHSV